MRMGAKLINNERSLSAGFGGVCLREPGEDARHVSARAHRYSVWGPLILLFFAPLFCNLLIGSLPVENHYLLREGPGVFVLKCSYSLLAMVNKRCFLTRYTFYVFPFRKPRRSSPQQTRRRRPPAGVIGISDISLSLKSSDLTRVATRRAPSPRPMRGHPTHLQACTDWTVPAVSHAVSSNSYGALLSMSPK